jgi:hypothetical protein
MRSASVPALARWQQPRRRLAAATAVAAVLLAVPAAVGVMPGKITSARADEYTISQDALRDGWDQAEPGLSPSVVSGSSFGQLFATKVNGQVFAQPVVVGSTVIAATENDYVYGINAVTGAIQWSRSLGTPYHITTCGNIAPNIGVTAGPVYDPAVTTAAPHGLVLMVAQIVYNGSLRYRLFMLDPVTGARLATKFITGSPVNDSSLTFNAAQQLERPGLLLMNGWVYAAFGSHCDHKPYVGYVAGVNVATEAVTLWTDESGVTENMAGIWQSGGGLMSDGPGRIFFTSGNGVSPPARAGTSPPGQLAESVVRLAVSSTGTLSAKDFFSPANAPTLDAGDTDFGSGGPTGLPFGTSTYPALLMQAGKDGRIFILNRTSLGGREQGPGGSDADLAMSGPWTPQFGHPAAFADTPSLSAANAATAHDYMYYAGKNGYLHVFRFGVASSGKPTLADIANSAGSFPYSSGSPVVTSKGTDPASAVVWIVHAAGIGGPGTLEAFAGEPTASCAPAAPCTLSPIFSAPAGNAAEYTVPATSNSSVYVGTIDGYVYGFGVKPAAPLAAQPATFSATNMGSSATQAVTATASSDVTVSGVTALTTTSNLPSTAAQFTAGPAAITPAGSSTSSPASFPVTLHRGDKITVPVTFSPAVPGGATGTLSFATPSASLPSTDVPLAGQGLSTGLYASTSTVQFALVGDHGQFQSWVPANISVSREITITNGSAVPQRITSVSLPAGPYQVTGLPSAGTVLVPGQSFAVQVTITPHGPGVFNSSLDVAGSSGASAAVSLQSQSLAPISQFTVSPSSLNLGAVPAGKQVEASLTITNSGNQPATAVSSSGPAGPFHAMAAVLPGLPVSPSDDLTILVSFIPPHKAKFSTHYRLIWKDSFGAHTLTIPITGTGI